MKNMLFIVSHLGSGSNILFDWLDKNPKIQGNRIPMYYSNPIDLEAITSKPHKTDNTAAIYMDELLFNYSFACPQLYNTCKFIYFIREARPTLNKIVSTTTSLQIKYTPERACKYYKYRLRRMCEMSKRTPGAIFFTFDDLVAKRKLDLIEKYLNLKKPIVPTELTEQTIDVIDVDIINEAQESYDRHFYYLKSFLT